MIVRGTSLVRWSAILVGLALVGSACSGATPAPQGTGASGAPSAAAVVGGTMNIRLIDDWGDLNPMTNPRQTAIHVQMGLYDRVLANDKDGKLIPYLAESWTITPTQLTFKIKDGPTCADGTPMTASAIANFLKTYQQVNTAQITRGLGPGPYTFSADDASRTLTVGLGTPYSDAIFAFAGSAFSVVCPKGLADPKAMMTTSYGSGPFVIDSAAPGDNIVLRTRPEWNWGAFGITAKTPGFPEKLVFKVVQNDTTAANLLISGGLDISRIDGPDQKRLQNEPGINGESVFSFFAYPMVMNESPGRPTADEKIREALVAAVDPEAYNQTGFGGLAKTAKGMFDASWECFSQDAAKLMPQQPGPDKAKQILLAAGWTQGAGGKLQKDGKPLLINLMSHPEGSGPEYISEQFDRAGITVKFDGVDPNTNSVRVRGGQYDVAIQRAGGLAGNPSSSITLYSGPLPPQGTNYSYIIDPTLDQLVAATRSASSADRCRVWGDVQKRLLEKHHVLPLAHPRLAAFARGIDFVQTTMVEPGSIKRRAK